MCGSGGNGQCDGILVGAEITLIDNVSVAWCDVAVQIHAGTDNVISNSYLGDCRHALLVDGNSRNPTTISFVGNDCESRFSQSHIKITGTYSYPVHNIVIRDNYFTMNEPQMDGVTLEHVNGVVIQGNIFQGGFPGAAGEAVVFVDDVKNVFIAGNVLRRYQSHAWIRHGSGSYG